MKFSRILVEKAILNENATQKILAKLSSCPYEVVNSYLDYFEKVRKPYLHKRTNLYLYLAQKKGELVKEAPNAYGTRGESHFYYYNALNCIYECEYCYLQGYFSSPDIVLFLNHEEILAAIEERATQQPGRIWFHGGEFSDSLALAHLSGELLLFAEFFSKRPRLQWELRTKSANIRPLLSIDPTPNIHVSFSISPPSLARLLEHKAAPVELRLRAARRLIEKNFSVAFHCDPIVAQPHVEEEYRALAKSIAEQIPIEAIRYISLGALRFPQGVYDEVRHNYPKSFLFHQYMIPSQDKKMRYRKYLRRQLLQKVQNAFLSSGFLPEQLYFCMEDDME
ncbi:MAG: hypothetical protein NZM25_07270 [Leptospiraceae bacterium]|nr:hypothetical protein [Leptospiraceae bacterium]MDW8307119.1 hypothetical protein [Leptospiraceae bacterium]